MKLKEFIKIIEAIAPPEGAMAHDNIGLLVGPDHDEIKSVLVGLDCTPVTAKEAEQVLFLVEVQQAGIFGARGFSEEQLRKVTTVNPQLANIALGES